MLLLGSCCLFVLLGVLAVLLMQPRQRQQQQQPGSGFLGGDPLTETSPRQDIVLTGGGLTLTFARRLAGAVHTLSWRGAALVVPLQGNGGSMQSAIAYDIAPGESPEVENPTEAGNWHDAAGQTSSEWVYAARSATSVMTKCRMAYYYVPGEPVASSPSKTRARGGGRVSDTTLTKRVTIVRPGAVNYDVRFECPSPHTFAQAVPLCCYMPRAWSTYYVLDGGQARPVSAAQLKGPQGSAGRAVIVAQSAELAVGIKCTRSPQGPYAPWVAVDNTTLSGTNTAGRLTPLANWSVVHWVKGRVPRALDYSVALVFGTVAECAAALR